MSKTKQQEIIVGAVAGGLEYSGILDGLTGSPMLGAFLSGALVSGAFYWIAAHDEKINVTFVPSKALQTGIFSALGGFLFSRFMGDQRTANALGVGVGTWFAERKSQKEHD
jgi:hypothetical protein